MSPAIFGDFLSLKSHPGPGRGGPGAIEQNGSYSGKKCFVPTHPTTGASERIGALPLQKAQIEWQFLGEKNPSPRLMKNKLEVP